MIIKSLSRKTNTAQLLTYLFAKEEKLSVQNEKPLVIKHNLRTSSLNGWIKEFEKNESLRLHKRVDNVKVYHTILSFSSDDKKHITEKTLHDIAKHFIKLRGKDSLFIGAAHYDKDHVHLHIAMSGTKYQTGESNRISRLNFQELKLAMDSYQKEKFPKLIHSLPQHGKGKQSPGILKNSRAPEKEKLLQTLETVFTKSNSTDDFITGLANKGYESYYRAGKLTGIKTKDGIKFRFSRLGYPSEKVSSIGLVQSRQEKILSELGTIRGKSKTIDLEKGR